MNTSQSLNTNFFLGAKQRVIKVMRDLQANVKKILSSFFEANEEHTLIKIDTNIVHIYHFKNDIQVEKINLSLNEIKNLSQLLPNKTNAPISVFLEDWPLIIKRLQTHHLHFWETRDAIRTFKNAEYDSEDFVETVKTDHGCIFYGLKSNATLQHVFGAIHGLQNPIAQISISEFWCCKKYDNTESASPYFLLKATKCFWSIIVGQGDVLYITRSGSFAKLKDLQNELNDTITHAVNHFNLQQKNFSYYTNLNSIEAFELSENIQFKKLLSADSPEEIYKKSVLQNSVFNCLIHQKTKLLDFEIPLLSWHKIAYNLPRILIKVILPFFGLTLVAATFYYIFDAYYQREIVRNSQERNLTFSAIEKVKPNRKEAILFNTYKSLWQNSPAQALRFFRKVISTHAVIDRHSWQSENGRFNLTLHLTPKKRFKNNLMHVKEMIEKKTHQKYPNFSMQWHGHEKLNLIIVGPVLFHKQAEIG